MMIMIMQDVFLTSGIKIVCPISHRLREEVSSVIISNTQLLQENKAASEDDNNMSILCVLMLVQNQ